MSEHIARDANERWGNYRKPANPLTHPSPESLVTHVSPTIPGRSPALCDECGARTSVDHPCLGVKSKITYFPHLKELFAPHLQCHTQLGTYTKTFGAGEIVHCLIAIAILPEDTATRPHTTVLLQVYLKSCSDLLWHQARTWYTYIYASKCSHNK